PTRTRSTTSLARVVVTSSSRTTSSTAERTKRVQEAPWKRARTITGIAACRVISHHQPQPEAEMSELKIIGSQPRLTLKTRMKTRPVKKVGSEKPTKAKVLATWSTSV